MHTCRGISEERLVAADEDVVGEYKAFMKICFGCQNRYESQGWSCPQCHFAPALASDGNPLFAPYFSEQNEGFPTTRYNEESGNFWFRARNRLIIWALRKYFPAMKNFFEVGCGTGYVLSGIQKAFPSVKLYGAEIYSEALTVAARNVNGAEMLQMDATRIPYEGEFDVIGAFDVLEHIKEDELVLKQIHQALRGKASGVILTVPQHMSLWSVADEYACHVRRYSRAELASKLTKSGFRIIAMTSFVSTLLPLMYLSRLKAKSLRDYDPTGEFQIPFILNRALEAILVAEQAAIRTGISLPVGGSLLAIAAVD